MLIKQKYFLDSYSFEFKDTFLLYKAKELGISIEKNISYLEIQTIPSKISISRSRYIFLSFPGIVLLAILFSSPEPGEADALIWIFILFVALPLFLYFCSKEKFYIFQTSSGNIVVREDKKAKAIISELNKRSSDLLQKQSLEYFAESENRSLLN